MEGREPTYRCFYPQTAGLRNTFIDILQGFELHSPFANVRRDIANLVRAVRGHFP
ncbi:MAG: bifunctional isocitrate dehydrogenase kinase/phosphatase, partial [Proteobacteria bacterium]|nr:bifunctional isocitrate dehydrogenase kinase/phosphatase [Pseudomonadota bacterium]